MDSGRPANPKRYYKYIKTGTIFQQANYGFDVDTGVKRVILKNTSTGERWDMPEDRLFNEEYWERLPDEKPRRVFERPYPGFINDPREEHTVDGYNVFGVREDRSDRTNYDFDRGYSSFARR